MIKLTLPDGQIREYDAPITGADVANDIGPGLAKAALAIRINDEMRDLSSLIEKNCNFSILGMLNIVLLKNAWPVV